MGMKKKPQLVLRMVLQPKTNVISSDCNTKHLCPFQIHSLGPFVCHRLCLWKRSLLNLFKTRSYQPQIIL